MSGAPLTILAEEEQIFRETIREFADRELTPRAAKMDQQGHFDAEIIPKLFDLGVMAIETPEAYGGAGGSFLLRSVSHLWISGQSRT